MKAKIGSRLLAKITPAEKRYDVYDQDMPGFLLRVETSGRATYYVKFRLRGGEQRMVKVGDSRIITVGEARDAAKRILADATQGEDPQQKKKDARCETLRQFLDTTYGPWLLENRKSGAYMLERLRNGCESLLGKRLLDITPWAIEQWRRDFVKRGALVTCNRHLSYLRAALARAVEWNIIKTNPLETVKRLKVDNARQGVIRTLSPEEEAKLWGAVDAREKRLRFERDSGNLWRRARNLPEMPDLGKCAYADFVAPMLTLALHCGCRRGELFGLTWADVDLASKTLTIRAAVAKSGKTRTIPLNDVAHDCLSRWREQTAGDVVFPSPQGGGNLTTIKKTWAALMLTAGITGLRLHDLRHTFCSRLLQAGADIQTVRELAGHSDIQTTAGYLHSDPTAKKSAVARLVTPQTNIIPLKARKRGKNA